MKKRILIFCCSLFLLSSCGIFLARVFFGIKNVKPKTEKQILNYLDRKNISAENLYGVTTKNYQREWEIYKKKDTDSTIKQHFETFRLYNKDGFEVIPVNSKSALFCIGSIGDFIGCLTDSLTYEIDSTQSIYNNPLLSGGLTNLAGKEVPLFEVKNHDLTLVIYWTIFSGRLSLHDLELEERARTNEPRIKVQVVKINMDPRDYMIKEGFNMKEIPSYHDKN